MGAVVAGASFGALSGSTLEAIMSLGDPSTANMGRSCAIGAEAGAVTAVVSLAAGRFTGYVQGYEDARGNRKALKPSSGEL